MHLATLVIRFEMVDLQPKDMHKFDVLKALFSGSYLLVILT